MNKTTANFIIFSMFALAFSALLASCEATSPEQLCSDKQAEYEAGYQAEFGTTEGMDPNKYTYDPDSRTCATNQGVQG